MAFFRDPGEMFLGCLGTVEQRFLVTLIETAAQSGYTRFVEPCAGTFAMANLAVRSGFKPEQIETSDVDHSAWVCHHRSIFGVSGNPCTRLYRSRASGPGNGFVRTDVPQNIKDSG